MIQIKNRGLEGASDQQANYIQPRLFVLYGKRKLAQKNVALHRAASKNAMRSFKDEYLTHAYEDITNTAIEAGFKSNVEVSYLCFMSNWLGHAFLKDPLQDWVYEAGVHQNLMKRLFYMKSGFKDYISKAEGEGGVYLKSALKRLKSATENAETSKRIFIASGGDVNVILRALYPEKYKYVGQKRVTQLIQKSLIYLDRQRVDKDVVAVSTLAFFSGWAAIENHNGAAFFGQERYRPSWGGIIEFSQRMLKIVKVE